MCFQNNHILPQPPIPSTASYNVFGNFPKPPCIPQPKQGPATTLYSINKLLVPEQPCIPRTFSCNSHTTMCCLHASMWQFKQPVTVHQQPFHDNDGSSRLYSVSTPFSRNYTILALYGNSGAQQVTAIVSEAISNLAFFYIFHHFSANQRL